MTITQYEISETCDTFLFVTIGCVLIVAICFSGMYLSNQTSAGNTPLDTTQALLLYDKERQENVDLSILIEQLSDKDENSREINKKRIIQLAQQSEENRNTVVSELLKRVQTPGFKYQIVTESASYFLECVTQLFNELKAVEAVDFLIDCMDCTAIHQYASDSYRHKPALRALMGLKQLAIPKLSETLNHPDRQIRIYAALCLSNIGGDAARERLSYALSGEPDPGVRFYIKGYIESIDQRSKR